MKKFLFCIKDDCRLACQAENVELAWQWLSATKHLKISELKKLYKIKEES